ncbi:LysR family transcriptional regulator [Paucibacter sp. KBW04]|uniref:LysR family transcriptional regulator n=1 Tax=Paucibacter sp. KBW04 TaxID=2153361 RepID=UPI0018CC300C|nr:LysR family transcriptional regulator [Paucibacter sp. KBW04]
MRESTSTSDLAALHEMALFVEVARAGSFSRASLVLGMPGATLSRRIKALERQLGLRLFERSTRRVMLSDAGELYFERCAPLVDQARQASAELRALVEQPSGHVRLSVPVDLGLAYIGPLLPEFAAAYPEISLNLDLSPRYSDLIGERVDVAIRLGELRGEHLVARKLGQIERQLFASPEYLARHAAPRHPSELAQHDCLFFAPAGAAAAQWRLCQGPTRVAVEVRGRFSLNNPGLMAQLAVQGQGIAALAERLSRAPVAAGELVRVLPDWRFEPLPVHAVMASRLQPAAVRALIDFLLERLLLL